MTELNSLFEDTDFVVINKPAGLVVNNAVTVNGPTVQTMVADQIETEDSDEESEFSLRGGIVHRLDKGTSGLLVIAKNEHAFTELQSQFKARTVKKTYIALVFGVLSDSAIEVDAPIKRNPKDRMKYAVVADGKPAQTKFEKISELELANTKFTMMNAYPKTGRTHQIRVHLAALGHPVVGDPVYANRLQRALAEQLFTRMMLHSYKITLQHPTTGKSMDFEAPLPPEFANCLEQSQLS